jgi:FkbM family methyltransferase
MEQLKLENQEGNGDSSLKNVILHFMVALQNKIVNQIVTFGYNLDNSSETMVRLGTIYGGWWIPKTLIGKADEKRVAISVGIGHDVSFDKELLSSGFTVIALDPLEVCVAFAREELKEFPTIHLENLGLASFSGEERFFAPKHEGHDSWSSTNSQITEHDKSAVFQVISLPDLLTKYETQTINATSVLKMDIEGAESKIIPSLCNLEYSFDYVAIEMDFLALIPFVQIRKRVKHIREARFLLEKMKIRGYRLILRENFNYFWVYKPD